MAKIINSKQIKVKKIIDDIIKVMQKHFKKHIGSTTIPMDANGNIFPDPHLPKNNNKKTINMEGFTEFGDCNQ